MSGCPSTSLEVKTSSEGLKCAQPEVYHCLRNQVGEKTEKCIKPSWIQRGLCAEYNTIAERLDAKGCQLSRGLCPDKAYLSNDVISFSGCAPNEVVVTTINTTSSNNIRFESHGEGISMVIIIPILCIAVIGIALGVTLLFHYRRKSCGHTNGDEENTVPLMKMEGSCGNDEEEKKKNHLKKEEEHLKFFECKGESQKDLIQRTKESLQSNRNVLIIGKPGSGKTTLAWTACKQMHGDKLEDKTWYVKASTSTKQLPDKEEMTLILLLDGRFENAWTTAGTIEKLFKELEELRNKLPSKNMLTIATMTPEAHQRISEYDCITKLKPMDIIDLDSQTNGLTAAEMTTVLNTYGISVKNVTEAEESHVLSQDQLQAIYQSLNYHGKKAKKKPKIGFPLIAALMSLNSSFISNNEFGKEPIKQILESIKRLRESSDHADKNKYCTIVYASFHWGYVDTSGVDRDLLAKIGGQHGHSNAEIDPDFFVLRKRSDILYEFLHESLLWAFFAAYGSQYLAFVTANCPLQVMLEYIVSNRKMGTSDEGKLFFLPIGGTAYENTLIHRIKVDEVDIRHHRIWEQNGFREAYRKINAKKDESIEKKK